MYCVIFGADDGGDCAVAAGVEGVEGDCLSCDCKAVSGGAAYEYDDFTNESGSARTRAARGMRCRFIKPHKKGIGAPSGVRKRKEYALIEGSFATIATKWSLRANKEKKKVLLRLTSGSRRIPLLQM